jgi:hypothetical protein
MFANIQGDFRSNAAPTEFPSIFRWLFYKYFAPTEHFCAKDWQ